MTGVFQQILAWMQMNIDNPFTLEDIAKNHNLSTFQVYRLFKKNMGISPSEAIWTLRLDSAKDLMENSPDLSLSEIAVRNGFKHQSHFSTLFKQKFSMTPFTYRSQARSSRKVELSSFEIPPIDF